MAWLSSSFFAARLKAPRSARLVYARGSELMKRLFTATTTIDGANIEMLKGLLEEVEIRCMIRDEAQTVFACTTVVWRW